jgi:hypothetical protein
MVKIKKTRKLKGGTHNNGPNNNGPFTEEKLQLMMEPKRSSMGSRVSFKIATPSRSANRSRNAQNLNSQIDEKIEEEAKLTKSIKYIKELIIKLERDDSNNDPNRKKVQLKEYAGYLESDEKKLLNVRSRKYELQKQKLKEETEKNKNLHRKALNNQKTKRSAIIQNFIKTIEMAEQQEFIQQEQMRRARREEQIRREAKDRARREEQIRREAKDRARREEEMRQKVLARRKKLKDNKERNLQQKAVLKILQEYIVKYSREHPLHSKKSASTVTDEPFIILDEMKSNKKTLSVIEGKLFVFDEIGNMRPFSYDQYKSYIEKKEYEDSNRSRSRFSGHKSVML